MFSLITSDDCESWQGCLAHDWQILLKLLERLLEQLWLQELVRHQRLAQRRQRLLVY
jgi:hypothetical protein